MMRLKLDENLGRIPLELLRDGGCRRDLAEAASVGSSR